MEEDGTLNSHATNWEKVLVYRYNPLTGTQRIVAPISCDSNASTKRHILAEAARVFDSFSFYLPVLLRGHILLSEIWKSDLERDEQIPVEISPKWKSLSADFSGLGTISFPKKTFSEDK